MGQTSQPCDGEQHPKTMARWRTSQAGHIRVEYVYAAILACVSIATIAWLANDAKAKDHPSRPLGEASYQDSGELQRGVIQNPAGQSAPHLPQRIKVDSSRKAIDLGGESSDAKSKVM